MRIRGIHPGDWKDIERIQAAAYPLAVLESMESRQCHWSVSADTCQVAESQDGVIGYILAHPWSRGVISPFNEIYSTLPDECDTLFIHDLALSPRSRGSGTGLKLVQTILQAGTRIGLKSASLISVQGSKAFWNRCGFVTVEPPSDAYADAVRQLYPLSDVAYMELGHGMKETDVD